MTDNDLFDDDDMFDDLDLDDLDELDDLDWDDADTDSGQMEVYDLFEDVRDWRDEANLTPEEEALVNDTVAVIEAEVQSEYQGGDIDTDIFTDALDAVYDWYPEAAGFIIDGLLSPLATIGPQARAAAEEWAASRSFDV